MRTSKGIPFGVFAFFVFCFAFHPFSPFFTHHLADPDDYMRLNEVVSWLSGQSWYDLSSPRLSPGAQTIIHWSRLVDLPIALIALPFIKPMGLTSAVLMASMIVPLIWFAVLLALLSALGRISGLKERAPLVCVMVLFAPMLLFNYTPGRVDHHGIQAIIAGFGLLGLGQILRDEHGKTFAILVAFAFSCGFWIGAEALPWVILFVTLLALACAWRGGQIARDAALFGICLPLFTLLFIPLALPPAEYSSQALSWFSPAYAIFAALAGGVFVAGWIVGHSVHNKAARLSLYALLSILAGSAFFVVIPSSLHGPFTDYDTFDATTALDNITEAQPLIRALHFNPYMPITLIPLGMTFARLLALPLLAVFVCLTCAKREQGKETFIWLAQNVFLGAALLLTVFWQLRVGIFMELFALAPLTKLLCIWWDKLRWGLWDRPLFWAEIAVFGLLGPLPVILLPALIAKSPLYPDLILFPAARSAPTCALDPLIPFLNESDGLGAKTLTVMNTSDTGPQILFETRHNAIAGNFDVPGNADAFTFFGTHKEAEAQEMARKWKADLVLLCKDAPQLYLGQNYYALNHTKLLLAKDGLLHFTNTDADQPFIERLIRGDSPSWLSPVEIPLPSDYLVFKIQLPAGKK